MKIKEFIQKNIDIDVYDDYMEELGIAFCGPVTLTEEGERVFADVLEYEIIIYPDCAVVLTYSDDDDECETMVNRMTAFFHAAAGYCSESNYDKWFVDQE